MNTPGCSVLILHIHKPLEVNTFIDFYEFYPTTHQWRTFSILFITFLMSSLALLRVSARIDRDIVALLSSSFPVLVLADNRKFVGTYSIGFKHFWPFEGNEVFIEFKDQKSKPWNSNPKLPKPNIWFLFWHLTKLKRQYMVVL